MVDANVILASGSSVKRGLGSLLTALSGPDFQRLFGFPPINLRSGYPAPLTVTMPGTKLYTPKLPYAVIERRTIVTGAGAAGTTLQYSGTYVGAEADSWIWIETNSDGQGLLKKVDVDTDGGGGAHTLDIDGTWGGNGVAANGTVVFFTHSHTVLSSSGTTVTKTGTTNAITASDDDKFVVFFTTGRSRRIDSVNPGADPDKFVVDDVWGGDYGPQPAVDDGFIVLRGAGAGETLATATTGAVLLPLQIRASNAPCLLTGTDYPNFNLQPGYAAPTLAGAEINCDPEMYSQFRARFGTDIYGLDLSRDSCTISPFPIGTSLRPLYFAWQHDMTDQSLHPSPDDGLYEVFAAMILSMKGLVEAENKVFKPRVHVILCAENDQIPSEGGAVRHKLIGENLKRHRDAVRALVGNPNLPCVLVGPSSGTLDAFGVGYPYRDEVYAQIQELVLEDTNTEYVDTTDATRYTFVADGRHLDTPSQINLGVDIPLAYDKIVDGNAVTEVGIANMALSHIGERAKIASLTEESAQAQHCNQFYAQARDLLLEQHSWDFASRRAPLVPVTATGTTNTRTEWAYAYEAPRKMAGAISVLPPGARDEDPSERFLKQIDAAGRTVIYTDVRDATIRYNRFVSNTRKFSSSFTQALSWMLASMIAGPITKNMRTGENCLARAMQFTQKAAAVDAIQGEVDAEIEAPWMPGGSERRAQLWRLSGGSFPLQG